MKKQLFSIVLLMSTNVLQASAQDTLQLSDSILQEVMPNVSQQADSISSETMLSILQQLVDVPRYKLYPTENMWTFIKLDTQTGKMCQVQYGIEGDDSRFEASLSTKNLLPADEAPLNGRFELYPTQNMYNFILLDKINGRTWQVQWSTSWLERGLFPINDSDIPIPIF